MCFKNVQVFFFSCCCIMMKSLTFHSSTDVVIPLKAPSYTTCMNKLKALRFSSTCSHMISVLNSPIAHCPTFEIAFLPFGMGMFWPTSHCFSAVVAEFHTIFHTRFVPWLFTTVSPPSRTVSRHDIFSERALLLAFNPPSPSSP